jgi:pimeloyl-ACP methyl ester carboxylesterase
LAPMKPRYRFLVGALCIIAGLAACGAASASEQGSEPPRLPVLLIHGYKPLPGYAPTLLWQTLAESLSGNAVDNSQEITLEDDHSLFYLPAVVTDGRDVFISGYGWGHEPTARDIRLYSARVADEIAWITDAQKCEHLDVVAHSMGGLIARAYIEADDFLSVLGEEGFPDYGLSYREDVRMLVTLGTPHHGVTHATLGDWLGPSVRQMAPKSRLLALLNRETSAEETASHLHSDVIYVTFAGQSCLGCRVRADEQACLRNCVTEVKQWTGSDGVVQMKSARLAGADNHAFISLEHTSMRAHPVVCAAVVAALDGRYVPEFSYTSPELRVDDRHL